MAHTVELLSLIEEYPDAFLEPTEAPLKPASQATGQSDDSENSELMSLISEFPEAFTEPELPSASASSSDLATTDSGVSESVSAAVSELKALEPPTGYEFALHQELTTFGWGKVSFYFRYGNQGLNSVWMTVGKSGTEVQSFCEAISRLTNRLLAAGTPTLELVKELRGIRGGDSEGLGPHRFLGLVDLLGKALHEAPGQLETQVAVASHSAETPVLEASTPVVEAVAEISTPVTPSVDTATPEHQWLDLSDTSAIASICPDCGAELQQVNGCSGGACVVCGFSSCS